MKRLFIALIILLSLSGCLVPSELVVDSSGGSPFHTQNTDTILTTNGVQALINAGRLVYDLKTDRWLLHDTNTFLGVGVIGAGNLAHTAGSEGYFNTAFGCDALSSIILGHDNTAVGNNAAEGITNGVDNTAVGSNAAQTITIGNENTVIGSDAAQNITEGDDNVAIGRSALDSLTTGNGNVAIGRLSLSSLVTGSYNTVVGEDALFKGTGSSNVAIGLFAGHENTGSSNVFIGASAGYNEAGSNKLYIDNTNTATPLIYGDFSTNQVTVNNNLTVNGAFNYGADAGASDDYTCAITGITTYTTGLVIYFKANTVNTGAATINVNTLGAKALKVKGGSVDPEDHWIIVGEIVHCIYDGTNFQILSPDAEP